MAWHRIWAVVMRHLYNYTKSLDRLSDSIYWPAMDIILWGLTTRWLQTTKPSGGLVLDLALITLTALVFWQVVWRANYEISVNLLEEFWNQNLVNLFATPLTKWEWVTAVMILGLMKMFFVVGFGAVVVWLMYQLNIFTVGWAFMPFIISLLLSGWFMGFLGSALIIYWGQKVQTLAWTMGFLFAPLSAVFYPVEALPSGIQLVARSLPMTYIFEGMRGILTRGEITLSMLTISFALNFIYLALALLFFSLMFELSRRKGFNRLE